MDTADQLSFIEIFARLVIAGVIGSVLGIERRLHGKPAGMRTHALVALGSALFALIGLQLKVPGGSGDQAFSHVLQGIIVGVGFLGTGAIIKEGQNVHGLTTGASVWIVAGLGLACGAGYWRLGLLALMLALTVQIFGGRVEHYVTCNLNSLTHQSGFGSWLFWEPPPPTSPTDIS